MLTLKLVEVPWKLVRGGYPVGPKTPNGMPLHALYCHPDVYWALLEVLERIVITDLWRTPNSSLHAMLTKAGVQPPGWSDHGWGFALDLVVKLSLERGKFKSRRELDAWLTARGFPMFWILPGVNNPGTKAVPVGHEKYNAGLETYHHSYFTGADLAWLVANSAAAHDTTASAEARAMRYYGAQLAAITNDDVGAMLDKLHYDPEDHGLAEFQRAMKIATWHAKKRGRGPAYVEGVADPVTRRCLAFCAAEREIVSAPAVAA